jgi:hypothetical protein
MRTPPAYGALGFSKRNATALINGVFFFNTKEMTREEKLETIVKLLAKSMFYGDWEWETPNERVITMLMQEIGMYPFKDEDDMISKTPVSDDLYKRAIKEIPTRPAKGGNEWWKGNLTVSVPNDDLVPFHTVCGCTTCMCIMPNKLVRKDGSVTTVTTTGTTYIHDNPKISNTNEK